MISIDNEDLDISYSSGGAWRGYALSTEGTTYEELIDAAVVFEIDQDGGEVGDNAYDDCVCEVQEAVERKIKTALLAAQIEALI